MAGHGAGREDFVAIGTVAVSDVRFDSRLREMLAPSVLDGIVLLERLAKKKLTPLARAEQLKE
jgi:hypothetical protein